MANSKNIELRKKQYVNTLLGIIRREPPASRSLLKKASGLSMETVLQTVEGLLADGTIYESGSGGAPVGRKATWLSINPQAWYYLGVKFTDLKLCGVLMDFDGQAALTREVSFSERVTVAELLRGMRGCITELLDSLGDRKDRVRGIGVGVPGILDREEGVSLRYANIQDLSGVPIKRLLEEEFGLPVRVEQALKITLTAHRMVAENAKLRDMLFVLVKSGVGMAALFNGRLHYGTGHWEGEIGHLQVAYPGRRCSCGRFGCLESEIGYRAMRARMEEGLAQGGFPILRARLEGREPRVEDLIQALALGDPDAALLFGHACGLLADVVVHAVVMLNPQKIIFSGELTGGTGFLDSMSQAIAERCPREAAKTLALEATTTDDAFDALGAAYLMMNEEFPMNAALRP